MGNIIKISCGVDNFIMRSWDLTIKQTTYTRKLKENSKDLKDAMQTLRARRDDMKLKVDLAEEKLLKGLNEVEVWLSQAEDVIEEAEALVEAGPKEIDKLCLGGWFSTNYRSSYKFGKKVAKRCEEIANLRSQGVFPEIAENRRAAQMEVLPVQRLVGQQSTFDEVWRCLTDDDVGIIGLHGLGGVGKTTLLTHINNNFKTEAIGFDAVIFIEVSKDYTIEQVQEKIGQKIGLSNGQSWKNKSSAEKRRDIFEVLSRKKFVMLLDELWARVDLMKVGIPKPSIENGSKVVFTTRKLSVCGAMDAQKSLKMKCLGPAESWELFNEKVGGETLASDPEIPELAKLIVAECGGLPLALVTIGQAMAVKRNRQSWEIAIGRLQQSVHEEMKQVYECLRFSYDMLDNEKMKSCLLYCSLFPENYKIFKFDLIHYCIFEGVWGEFTDTISAQAEGHDIIESLVSYSLLEEEGEEHVKMHDVVRDMALWIGSLGEAHNIRTFVQARAQLTKAPALEKWRGVERISLIHNRIDKLVGQPECSALKTLFLNQNMLMVIGFGFFHSMSNLRVLNLSRNENLKKLPADISRLTSLECLDLSHTGIRELPVQLKALANLKDFSLFQTYLKRIPQQLICSFSKLEAFRMSSSPDHVTSEETTANNVLSGGSEGLIEELGCLQNLNLVIVEVKNNLAFEKLFSFPKLWGCISKLFLRSFSESKVLHLVDMERLQQLYVWYCHSLEEMKIQASSIASSTCFNKLQIVIMGVCPQLRDMTWLIHVPTLKSLHIMECHKLENIISEEKLTDVNEVVEIPNPLFPQLEVLDLRDLPELKSIFWEALPCPHLNRIQVSRCPKLKKLPLHSDSANKENLVILGKQQWWGALQWENEATRLAFLRYFELW